MKIKNMSMKVLAFVAATAALGSVAHAEREFPFLAPDLCKDSVIQRPNGAGGFYRSESCQTVYVLPPEFGKLSYNISVQNIMDQDCDQYIDGKKYLRTLYNQKHALEEQAYKPNISEKQFAILQKQIDAVQLSMDRLDKAQNYLAGLEGARMKVLLSSSLSDEVTRFQFGNQLLFAQGTRFEAVPIAESYVSFTAVPEDSGGRKSAIISTDIPGIEVRGVKSSAGSSTRIMNGGASGIVTLGLNAVCVLRDQQAVKSVSQIQWTPSQLETYITANLTYSVPVMSSYHYEAAMDYEAVVTDWLKKFEDHPDKFTVKALSDSLISAIGSKSVSWKFEALELQNRGITDRELQQWEEETRQEVFSGFARDLADHLTRLGVLEKMEPTPIPAPAPGTEEEIRYQRMCQSKSFLGVTYSHGCWDEPYRVVRLRGSSADNVINELRKLKLNFRESVEYRQPIYRTHTSSFKYQTM